MTTHAAPTSALARDARDFVSRTFGGVDTSAFDYEVIRVTIEKTYDGGYAQYVRDFTDTYRRLNGDAKAEALSPVKLKIKVEHMTGRKVRDYDNIVATHFDDLSVRIVVSYANVKYGSRTDTIKSRTHVLYNFSRPSINDPWSKSTIDVTESVDEGFIRYGAVMTPERHASIMEQFETCYRPGTDKAPMAGPLARAEVSHRDMHPDLYPDSYDA